MKNALNIAVFVAYFLYGNFIFPQTGWQSQSVPTGNYSLTSVFPLNPNVCFAASEYNIPTENYYAIYKTTNSGYNWLQISGGTGWFLKNIKFTDSLTGFACGGMNKLYMTENQFGKCVFKTTNNGNNWTIVYQLISTPGSEMEINDMCFLNSSTGWFSCRDGSVLKTSNGGVNFTAYYTNPNFKKSSVSFVGPLYGWTAGDSGRIAYTINGGINWSTLNSLTASHFKSIQFLSLNTGYVCGDNGIIFKSTNGGLNWLSLNSGAASNFNSLYFLNADTGWVSGVNTILKTTNGGLNWSSQYSGLAVLKCVRFLNPFIGWSCGSNKMLYTNSGGLVNIKEISSAKPSAYKLYNNYPNPFNPVTCFKFDISEECYAEIKIFSILGKEVSAPVNGNIKAGTYTVEFNGSSLPSGIYYYNLTAGDYSETKTMVLIK